MPMIFKSLPNQRPPGIQLPSKKAQAEPFPISPSNVVSTPRSGKKRKEGKKKKKQPCQQHCGAHTHHTPCSHSAVRKGLPTGFLSRFQFLPSQESLHKFSCVFLYTPISFLLLWDRQRRQRGGKTGARRGRRRMRKKSTIKVKHRGSITNMRSYDNIYVLVTDFLFFFFFFGLLHCMINRSLVGSPRLAGIMGRYHR
ncbi:hypothetical protein B9Z19DRAFT_716143 [Tuber borchii]|uniref:Uncharacterized protein n=1 Tax=Tuber borchii TaxID=42251 RepID=A0A2T6ZYL3_TUBBO|nr:hypothetical protein B9Z19DRAFT_716143 [Tuber borchii]